MSEIVAISLVVLSFLGLAIAVILNSIADELCLLNALTDRGCVAKERSAPLAVQLCWFRDDLLAVWSNGDVFISNDAGCTWQRYYGIPKAVNE